MHPNMLGHLRPNIREVCAILAAGLVRLSRHSAGDIARDAAVAREQGESSLHFVGHRSTHAKPNPRRQA
jgi:hypothetical protein